MVHFGVRFVTRDNIWAAVIRSASRWSLQLLSIARFHASALQTDCLTFVRVKDCYRNLNVVLPCVLWFALEISSCRRKVICPKIYGPLHSMQLLRTDSLSSIRLQDGSALVVLHGMAAPLWCDLGCWSQNLRDLIKLQRSPPFPGVFYCAPCANSRSNFLAALSCLQNESRDDSPEFLACSFRPHSPFGQQD